MATKEMASRATVSQLQRVFNMHVFALCVVNYIVYWLMKCVELLIQSRIESFDFHSRCILLWQLLPVKFIIGREIDKKCNNA